MEYAEPTFYLFAVTVSSNTLNFSPFISVIKMLFSLVHRKHRRGKKEGQKDLAFRQNRKTQKRMTVILRMTQIQCRCINSEKYMILNPLTLISDQGRISPYNINIVSEGDKH